MSKALEVDTQESALIVRCGCGAVVNAHSHRQLIERAQNHFAEFHPDLGRKPPAHLILAMADQKGHQ
jgi:hypothetical protein